MLVALALPGVVLGAVLLSVRGARLHFDVSELPERIVGYRRVEHATFEEDVLRQIRPDAYVLELLAGEGETRVWLFASFYGGAGAKGAHDPAICYPAQGWEVVGQRSVAIPLEGDERLHAQRLRTRRDGQEEEVLYWFQPAGRWPGPEASEQLLRIWDTFAGRPQHAFVRLSAPASPDGDEPPDLERIAAALAPHVRRTLEKPG